jgi:hypothetical protein
MLVRIDRYCAIQHVGTSGDQSAIGLTEPQLPLAELNLERPHSPTSMQTNITTTDVTPMHESPTPGSRYQPTRFRSMDDHETGNSVLSHTLKHSARESDVYNHITGSEPRVWPGAISSSMRRNPSISETDGVNRQNESQS